MCGFDLLNRRSSCVVLPGTYRIAGDEFISKSHGVLPVSCLLKHCKLSCQFNKTLAMLVSGEPNWCWAMSALPLQLYVFYINFISEGRSCNFLLFHSVVNLCVSLAFMSNCSSDTLLLIILTLWSSS